MGLSHWRRQGGLMFNPHFLTTYPQSHISQPRNLPHSTSATDGKKHPRISKATLSDVQPTHPHNSPTFHNLATYHTQPVRLTIRSTHASSQHFLMFNPHFLTTHPQSHTSQPRNLPHSTSATDGKKHPRISKATLSDVQPTLPHN